MILLGLAGAAAAAEIPREQAGAEVVAPGPDDGEEAPEDPDGEKAAEEAAAPARFDDWEVACAEETCSVVTRVLAADGTEVLRIEAGGRPALLRFSTALGLHLPDGLVARLGEREARRLPWRTCAPADGCLAEAPLDSELLADLRRERAGTATFTLVEGVSVRLGFSLMGFSAAWREAGAGDGQ